MFSIVYVLSTFIFFFFSSRRRHTRYIGDWSSDVCSSDLGKERVGLDDDAEPWAVLFVPSALRETELEHVTPAHAVPPSAQRPRASRRGRRRQIGRAHV